MQCVNKLTQVNKKVQRPREVRWGSGVRGRVQDGSLASTRSLSTNVGFEMT